MTPFERPAPDPDKIVTAWRTWSAQGPDVLAGRTMADLKIGGTDVILEQLAEQGSDASPAHEAWTLWERGKVGPESTLAALDSANFGAVVEALANAAA